DALVEADEMRLGESIDVISRGFETGTQKGDRRSLAVGAGDMNDGRQALFGMAERGEQPADAVEREVDELGVKAQKAPKDLVDDQRRCRAVKSAAARSVPAVRDAAAS